MMAEQALRDAAKVALAALELHARTYPHMVKGYTHDAANLLRAALAQPQAPSVPAEPEKMAPVQGYQRGIPWSLHLDAYDAYCKKYGPQPALIDLEGRGCRGGFGTSELDEFIPGWRDKVSELGRLKAEVSSLRAMLAAAPPVAQPQAPSVPAAWQERQAKRMRDGVVTEWTGWYECRSIDKARAEAPDHVPYEWRPLYTAPPVAQEAAMTDEEATNAIQAMAGEDEARRQAFRLCAGCKGSGVMGRCAECPYPNGWPGPAAQEAAGADPMDWPLPCDVVVGHGTMRKGVRLGALVSRMKALYEMATGQNADEVAGRSLEQRMAAPGLLQQAGTAQEAAGAVAPAEPIPTRATLIAALQWYADGLHFDKASPDAWDTVSGEPQNWWCDEAGTATIEDGSIAAMTLSGELTAEQLQEFEAGEAAAPVGLDAKAATERERCAKAVREAIHSVPVEHRHSSDILIHATDRAIGYPAAPQAQAAPPATEVQP